MTKLMGTKSKLLNRHSLPSGIAVSGGCLHHDRAGDDRFGLYPKQLAGDMAYGAAEMLGWLGEGQGNELHVPVFEKGERDDGTFSRSDFKTCQ